MSAGPRPTDADRRPSRRLAVAVLVASVLVFAALAVGVGVTVSLPPDLLERKVADAERHLYYRITHARGPLFELEGNESAIRLIVHAVVPSYDPLREVELGVRVELLAVTTEGAKPWRRDLYTRARQSKARLLPDGTWLDENTFSLHRGFELTDDRLVVVPLPAIVPGTKVRVTLLGDPQEGIVRAYTPIARADVTRRLDAMRAIDRAHLAEQLGFEPWDHVAASRDLATLRFAEHRLSAEGEEGEDYEIREIYTTGFRVREATVIERGVLVAGDRNAAVNVVGPATIEIVTRRGDALDTAPGKVTAALLGEGPPIDPIEIALPSRVSVSRRVLTIPAGTFTLSLAATRPARVELVPSQAAVVGLGGRPGAPLAPDLQRLSTFLAGPSGDPIRVAIAGPDDAVGRVIRVDVRPLAARDVNVMLDAFDADKKLVATAKTKLESELSPYETALLYGKQELRVAEPVSIRFVVPSGGRELRIRTDIPALVALSTPASSAAVDLLEPPYSTVELTTLLWRYARYADRTWLPIRPSNHAALTPDRLATVVAQARLEARLDPPPPDAAGTSIAPTQRFEKQTVIERVAPEDVASTLSRWSAGNFTRVFPGKKLTLDFSRTPDRATVSYYAAKSDVDIVGGTIEVRLDGERLDDTMIGSSGGTIELPRGLTGTHTLEIGTVAQIRMFVDRPPSGSGAELYAMRTVYRVPDDGRAARLRVTKRGTGIENVNLVFYTPNILDLGTQLRVAIDEGAPARFEGVALTKWTIADRTVPLPPSARPASLGFTDVGRGGALRPHLVAISLGDDLLPGAHTLDVRVTGSRPIWGRFFVLDGGGQTAPRAVQWRDVDDPSTGSSE